jgi:hypothetical protein
MSDPNKKLTNIQFAETLEKLAQIYRENPDLPRLFLSPPGENDWMVCIRVRGHLGGHIAHANGKILFTWEQDFSEIAKIGLTSLDQIKGLVEQARAKLKDLHTEFREGLASPPNEDQVRALRILLKENLELWKRVNKFEARTDEIHSQADQEKLVLAQEVLSLKSQLIQAQEMITGLESQNKSLWDEKSYQDDELSAAQAQALEPEPPSDYPVWGDELAKELL